jgi:methylated-DNA-[protein]-cysteine S-methyltransferase
MYFAHLDDTPVGRLLLAGNDKGLAHLAFQEAHFSAREIRPSADWEPSPKKLREPLQQLKAYFAGKLRKFELPLAAEGTDFQRTIWNALLDVPFGETSTYGEIARVVGKPAAARAVGLANGRNPIAIIVPCHRIIGAGGRLVGYGGGLPVKQILLQHETSLLNSGSSERPAA